MNLDPKTNRERVGNLFANMKKQVTTKEVSRIVSEPGDATRYDYYMAQDYYDFTFMPCKSTFRFPQRLNYYHVQDLTEEELVEMAEKHNCNPWTLKECIRSINERFSQ